MYQTLHKKLLALGDINFLVGIHMRLLDGAIKCISFQNSAIYCRQKYSVLQVLLN